MFLSAKFVMDVIEFLDVCIWHAGVSRRCQNIKNKNPHLLLNRYVFRYACLKICSRIYKFLSKLLENEIAEIEKYV